MNVILPPINVIGAVVCVVAFAITSTVGGWLGIRSEGPLMLLFGPLCLALDGAYRLRSRDRRWFDPDAGGSLLFLPIWLFGVFWLVLGALDTFRG